MRVMKGIGLGLTYTCRVVYEGNERDWLGLTYTVKEYLKVMKGIGLGLTCTHKGVYEGNERDRVRVNIHP